MTIPQTQLNHSAKPFLRWAGSKQQLIPTLSRYWDSSFSRYVEPFAGSASWFFSLSVTSAILGDINRELMLTYRQVKNHLPELIQALGSMRKGKRNYLYWRGIQPTILAPPIRAARFIYLNRFCFNGLYRTNSDGIFNVPYNGGAGTIPSEDALNNCSKALQKADLVTGGFEKTLEKVVSGDFVYLDPPFSVKAKRTFNEYDATVFSQDQLKLLREWMIKLDRKNISFLVSYADSEEGNFLSKSFYKETVQVRRNIAGFAANRRKAFEILISNSSPRKT